MGEFVRLEVADGVGTIRLDRPKMNALNLQVQERAPGRGRRGDRARRRQGRRRLRRRAGLRRRHRRQGDGRHVATPTWSSAPAPLQSAVTAVARIPKPVVAAVTGYALGGGCELALCADVRFAAENAVLGQPEILLGIIPGAGGTQRLTRLVGPSKAKDLIFTGRFVKADEALAIGLVDRVVPGRRRSTTRRVAWARQFAGAASYALRAAKEAIDRGLEVDLETGLEIERPAVRGLFATEDRTIGMQSFVENGPGKARVRGQVRRRWHGMASDKDDRPTAAATGTSGTPGSAAAPASRGPDAARPGGLAGLRGRARCSWRSGRCCVALDANQRQRAGRSSSSTAPTPSTSGSSRVDNGDHEVRRRERRDQERAVQLGSRRGGLAGRGPDPGPAHPALTVSRTARPRAVTKPTPRRFRPCDRR